MQSMKSVAIVALGVGLLALPARAADGAERRGPGGPRGPHGMGPDRVAEFLDLSDEQKASWEQMRDEFHASVEPLFEQQRASAEKLRQALEVAQPDALAVGKLVVSMHQQRKQTEALHEALQQRLRGTLTPDQQVKFDAAQALRPQHGPGGPGGMGFGPGFGMFGRPEGPRGMSDPAGRRGRGPRAQGPGF